MFIRSRVFFDLYRIVLISFAIVFPGVCREIESFLWTDSDNEESLSFDCLHRFEWQGELRQVEQKI